ncbi:MAG: class II fructose-bisphosphate aldolase [Patescibacteria group bacterium]|nr:class II fructose-bisphosphate aldolase [Patescibacteria group bacterium]
MRPLRDVIADYKQRGVALGHFNISDSNQLGALVLASHETALPVIAGLSEGERAHLPLCEARALIDAYKAEGIQIYLNADHTYSAAKAKEAIDAGVDSIVIDGAQLPLAENIAMTKEVVAYARASGRDVVVEGELGYIGTSSKQLDALPQGVTLEDLTTAADAKKFVQESGVDCFAPAVGNIHGMLKNAAEPRLHPDRVKEIATAVGVPLVLHGASGNTEEDVRACIKAGIAVVHINTELRVLYRDTLKHTLDTGDEVAPYKFLAPAEQKMQQYLAAKLRFFAGQ